MSNKIVDKIKIAVNKIKMPNILKTGFTVFLMSLTLGLFLLFMQLKKNYSKPEKDTLPSVRIAPENLYLPEDPLVLPPIQFSREQEKVWSDEKIEKFFVVPKNEEIENLHKNNTKKIDNLLEGIK